MVSALDDYLEAAARQMAARGRLLLAKIPRSLPAEYLGLVATTRDRLNTTITRFSEFAEGSAARFPASVRQRLFRRHVDDLDLIESIALTALHRAVDDDLRLTALVGAICREIRYPLPAPVVAAMSTHYFTIDPLYHVLLVPLTEGHFLLHLPDLYHELAHPLLADRHDPALDPFRNRFRRIVDSSSQHFEADRAAVRRGRTPPDLGALSASAQYSLGGIVGDGVFLRRLCRGHGRSRVRVGAHASAFKAGKVRLRRSAARDDVASCRRRADDRAPRGAAEAWVRSGR